MTAKQLKAAREAHWRQDQRPILTLEEAESWFLQHPLSLFLPRPAQLTAPVPSFVEACLGKANPTPPPGAIEESAGLLARLTASGTVIALNLFGAVGEQPDFLVHAEALPFVISLRGNRNWKHAPASSGHYAVSPLVVELWKLLEQEGPLTASAARERLGRELTEAALLRALNALWQSLRAIPVLQPAGQPALWELMQTHHSQALAAGSSSSQVTAISLLISMYLQSVYAATGEELETFLSTLVSRSRIREAVRGLSATKQIHSLSMDAQTYYFLEEGLPEFAAEAEPERIEPARRQRIHPAGSREGFLPRPSRFPAPAPRSLSASMPAAATDPASAAQHNLSLGKIAASGTTPAARKPKSDKPGGVSAGFSQTAKQWKGPRNYAAGNQRRPEKRYQEKRSSDGGQSRPGANERNSSLERRTYSAKQPPQKKTGAFPVARSAPHGPPSRQPFSRPLQQKPPQSEGKQRTAFPSHDRNRTPAKGFGPQRESAPGRERRPDRPGLSRPERSFSSSGGRWQSRQQRPSNTGSKRPGPAVGPQKRGGQDDRSKGTKSFAQGNWSPKNRKRRTEAAGKRTTGQDKPGRPEPGRDAANNASAKSPALKKRGFKTGAFKARGFGPRSSRPSSARPGGNPHGGKGNFRSRNAEKSKPKA